MPPRVFSSKFEIHYSLPRLMGKAINLSGELGPAVTLNEVFKEMITGDRSGGRNPGKEGLEFRSRALHIYAGNDLPRLANGLEGAINRRIAILRCDRVIPKDEQIPELPTRIRHEDMEGLLMFAVAGATRLLANGRYYTRPKCVLRELKAWGVAEDIVLEFLDDEGFKLNTDGRIGINDAYRQFGAWAPKAGYKKDLPRRGLFIERLVKTGK